MKNRLLSRILLSTAFAVGLVTPLAATYTPPAQAFQVCSMLSGRDSWTGYNADGSSYTVEVTHHSGVSVIGTPPPLADLPLVLVSPSGHRLSISTDGTGVRLYEGDFTSEVPETCSCPNVSCDYDGKCTEHTNNMTCEFSGGGGCTSTTCDSVGGGGCSGGRCTTVSNFSAAF